MTPDFAEIAPHEPRNGHVGWHLDPSQPRPSLTATVRLISTKVSRRPETT
ncbi:MAG: hypothetical protein WAN22_19820 [Solirubrobacteraceae bacterium]